jgi:hypothetical protein
MRASTKEDRDMAYSTVNEEEDYWRQLVAAAHTGKAQAEEEQRECNVHYTAAERAKLKYLKMNPARSSRYLEISTSEWAQMGDDD